MTLDIARLLFALGLPFVTGALFVLAVWPARGLDYRALVLGLAFPLGMVGIIAGYLVLDCWGDGLHFWPNVAIQLGLAMVFGAVAWWRRRDDWIEADGSALEWTDLSLGVRWLTGLLLLWLLLRWLGIVIEVVNRPLFPWDAWYAYGMQAKIWFFHPQLDSFAGGLRWFTSEEPAWAAGGTRHPPGVGLMQLWVLQAIGRWEDAVMNLAWSMAYGSLGFMAFGFLRVTGVRLEIAALATVLVLMLPVISTQATLAGYGDLWIAVLFMAAGGALWLARRLKSPVFILAAIVAAAGMLMIKQTSLMWMPVLLVGALAGWFRVRWIVLAFALGIAGCMVGLWLYGEPVRVSTLGRLGFGEEGFVWPGRVGLDTMWPALLKHLLVVENWHLYWYIVPVLSVVGIRWLGTDQGLRILWIMFVGGTALLVAFFSFTTLGNAVNDGTSVNRLLLHVVPLGALLAGVIAERWVATMGNRGVAVVS